MQAQLPQGITRFKDDDNGFLAWLARNPDGYVINSERSPKPSYRVLRYSGCRYLRAATPCTGPKTISSSAHRSGQP
jgi:hypothetical protein